MSLPSLRKERGSLAGLCTWGRGFAHKRTLSVTRVEPLEGTLRSRGLTLCARRSTYGWVVIDQGPTAEMRVWFFKAVVDAFALTHLLGPVHPPTPGLADNPGSGPD